MIFRRKTKPATSTSAATETVSVAPGASYVPVESALGTVGVTSLDPPTAAEPPSLPHKLRVVTYNIHHGRGIDGKYDLDRLAAVLAAENADIIALQEIEQHCLRSRYDDQPNRLAQALAMNVAFTPVRRNCFHPKAGYGNAILSRFPITATELFNLTYPGVIREARGCLHATLDIKGNPLHVFCVHLGLARQERHYQVEQLLSDKVVRDSRFGNGPKILLGDFNNWWPVKSARAMETHFQNACVVTGRRRQATYNGIMNMLCLDYIFTSPDLKILSYEVRRTGAAQVASDHFPVVCEVQCPW